MQRKRGIVKKLVIGVAALVVLAGAFIALLPTFVSMGLGHGFVRSAIEESINGRASFRALRVSWFDTQSIEELVITDRAGAETLRVDATLNAGLYALLTGSVYELELEVRGATNGVIRKDQSNSWQEVLVKDPGPSSSTPPSAPGPPSLGGVPPVKLTITDFEVQLDDETSGRAVTLRDLAGEARYRPGGDLRLALQGETESEGVLGSLGIDATIARLVTAAGVITPKQAGADITIDARSLPILYSDRRGELQKLLLTVNSDDLTQDIALHVEADAQLEGFEPSRLEGDVTASGMISEQLAVTPALDRLTGSISGRRVPTALGQPFLSGTPLVLGRDVGETIDLDAEFGSGAMREVTLNVLAPMLTVAAAANVNADTGAVDGERLHVEWTASPELVAALSPYAIDGPAPITIDLDSFSLPPVKDGRPALGAVAVRGSIVMPSNLEVSHPEQGMLAEVGEVRLGFDSSALAERVHVTGSATVDGAAVTLDETITGLIGADGSVTALAAKPVGTLEVRGLPGSTIRRFVAVEQPAVQSVLAGALDARVRTALADDGLTAELVATIGPLRANATATRLADAVRVDGGRVNLAVAPELFAQLQGETERPLRIREPAAVEIDLQPLVIPEPEPFKLDLAQAKPTATVRVNDLIVEQVPGFVEPVALRQFEADVEAQLGEALRYAVTGSARLTRENENNGLGRLDLRVDSVSGSALPAVVANLSDIPIVNVETALGREKRSLRQWLGDRGSVGLAARGTADGAREADLTIDMPRLAGTFKASLQEDIVALAASSSRLTLAREALESTLNPKPEGGQAPEAGMRIAVAEDVPLGFSVKELRFPLAMVGGEAFDPKLVRVDLELTGGPLKIGDGTTVHSSLQDLVTTVRTDDLARGVAFDMKGKARALSGGESGAIDVRGTVAKLVGAGSKLDVSAASLEMTANTERVPTAVADALLSMQGLLVAAVGPQMDSKFVAKDFSDTAGTLDADISTTNGFLRANVFGRERSLRTPSGTPIRAELAVTPPLRQRLLAPINPVLEDVRTTKEPVRATVTNALLPTDGDVRRMNADIEIIIGAVEFDSGSSMLKVLNFVKARNAATFPGYIEPIQAKIRKGVVTYDRFTMQVADFTFAYRGQVDLQTKKVDLETELPLIAISSSVAQNFGVEGLGKEAEQIRVKVKTTGKLGDLKQEIDPSFLAELAALRAQKAIGGGKKDGEAKDPLGGLFEQIGEKIKEKQGGGGKP